MELWEAVEFCLKASSSGLIAFKFSRKSFENKQFGNIPYYYTNVVS